MTGLAPLHQNSWITTASDSLTARYLLLGDSLSAWITPLRDEKKEPGRYEVTFDGTKLSSGMYVYRLIAGGHVESKTMMLLK
jgi:hypothetical protein